MSFSEDPYRVMRVVSNADGTVGWECSGCGGGWAYNYPSDVQVSVLRMTFNMHVRDSHKLLPEQTADWSGGY